jgi:putative transposase
VAVTEQLNSERFMDCSPAEVWATLLDEGTYLCSERTMYRILAAGDQVRERRQQRTHPPYARPELLAEAPNEVWSWDIERHEALCNRAVMKGHRLWSVAADW